MKQKLKEYKGITLIALIITIIVLLILAVVAISVVNGNGILNHAQNARNSYSQAQTNEQDMLSNYELILSQETGNAWKQEKTKVIKGDKILEVGDTITNFTAGGKTWKVLGAENGKLLLTTTENVNDSFSISGSTAGWDETEKRFVGAEKALDDECKAKITLTEAEKEQVEELRSIKVEDINRVTGYNPEKTGDGKVYGEGQINQYGNEVTYSLEKDISGAVTGIKYDSKNVTSECGTSTSSKKFMLPNTNTDITNPYIVISEYYYYYPHSLTTSKSMTVECKGIANDSEAYILLFRNPENTSNVNYWFGSSFINARKKQVNFCLYLVNEGCVNGEGLWFSSDGASTNKTYGVRPVVSLKSNFTPVK